MSDLTSPVPPRPAPSLSFPPSPPAPASPPRPAPSGPPRALPTTSLERPRRRSVVLAAVLAGVTAAAVTVGTSAGLGLYRTESPRRVPASPVTVAADAPSKTSSTPDTAALPADTTESLPELVARLSPSVVAINVDTPAGQGAGTGFVVTADGYLATNHHVVADARSVTVIFADGTERPATVVGSDASVDLAVVKVDATGLVPVPLADADPPVGTDVVAIGNALGLDGGLSVTRGIVSGTHREVDTNESSSLSGLLQTDAAINPGNSGGPLVDRSGAVVGINTAIANPSSSNNVGFAIPITNARAVLDDLRLGRTPAYLGLSSETVTPQLATRAELTVRRGAWVRGVVPGSPADRAGVRAGDVIVAVDGADVAGPADVLRAVRGHRPGDTLRLSVQRGSQRQSIDVTLTERPQ